MYLLVPFNIQIFEKSLEMIQSYEDTPVWVRNCAPKWSICPEQDFFWSTTNITLISISFTIKKKYRNTCSYYRKTAEKKVTKHNLFLPNAFKVLNFKELLKFNKKSS